MSHDKSSRQTTPPQSQVRLHNLPGMLFSSSSSAARRLFTLHTSCMRKMMANVVAAKANEESSFVESSVMKGNQAATGASPQVENAMGTTINLMQSTISRGSTIHGPIRGRPLSEMPKRLASRSSRPSCHGFYCPLAYSCSVAPRSSRAMTSFDPAL